MINKTETSPQYFSTEPLSLVICFCFRGWGGIKKTADLWGNQLPLLEVTSGVEPL